MMAASEATVLMTMIVSKRVTISMHMLVQKEMPTALQSYCASQQMLSDFQQALTVQASLLPVICGRG